MSNEETHIIDGIHTYDGYHKTKIWEEPVNRSTHYDYKLEQQCIISSRTYEELAKEMRM